MNFIYSNLSPNDFEILCQDILSNIFSNRFERFKVGKDEKIDLRLLDKDRKVIVQVKHCLGSYGSKYKSPLDKEFDLASKIIPKDARYLLITSLALSPHNKREIKKMSRGLINTESDIIGINEIEDILSKNEDIVKRHYKLWISSSAVLTRLLNNKVYGKSEDYLEKIRNKIKLFVQVDKFIDAQEILHSHGILLITGEPGIGKTTLAEMLCLGYLGQEYEFIFADDVSEAEDVFFDKEKKQIFLLDDFLGSNYLEFIEGKVESKILRFIERIKANKNKRLILSSRTTIFQNALLKGVHFNDQKWKEIDCILELSNYSYLERAKVLYNHLCYRELDLNYLESIREGEKYLKIIKHKNFNPRIIEFITSSDKIEGRIKDDYLKFVSDSLDNPASIWEPAYRNQIGNEAKILVQALFSLGGSALEKELEIAFDARLRTEIARSNCAVSDSPFHNSIKVLLDGFVSRHITATFYGKNETRIAFINPSISDFMIVYMKGNKRPFEHMIESVVFIEQIEHLIKSEIDNDTLLKSKKINDVIISPENFRSLASKNLPAAALQLVIQHEIAVKTPALAEMVNNALLGHLNVYEFSAVIKALDKIIESTNDSNLGTLLPDIKKCAKNLFLMAMDIADCDAIIKVMKNFGFDAAALINDKERDDEVFEAFENIVESEAENIINEDDKLNSLTEEYKVENRIQELEEEIRDSISGIGIDYSKPISAFGHVDSGEIVYKNFRAGAENEEYFGGKNETAYISDADIADVFKD